jgi:hypothetical protein
MPEARRDGRHGMTFEITGPLRHGTFMVAA